MPVLGSPDHFHGVPQSRYALLAVPGRRERAGRAQARDPIQTGLRQVRAIRAPRSVEASYSTICEPTSTVLSLGSWKASIGLAAFRAMTTNSFFRQRVTGGTSSVGLIEIREMK